MGKVIYLSEKKTMGQVKLVWILIDFLGVPLSLFGFIVNIDNIKSSIIAILAMIYLMCRVYFYIVQKKQAVREKDLKLWHDEMDKYERQQKMKSKSL